MSERGPDDVDAPPAIPLGRSVTAPARREPSVLFAIERADGRRALGIGAALPFAGLDLWNAWELSWLDPRGRPRVALAEFRVPADSPRLIESKSLKLYLQGFCQERLSGVDELRGALTVDLSAAAGAPVAVRVAPLETAPWAVPVPPAGVSIDHLELEVAAEAGPRAEHLRLDEAAGEVEETLYSELFKSNCPVTGQPDWAQMQIRYAGPRIDRAGLLRYLISYRQHAGFHEQCVERIFVDLRARCAPRRLSVYARYTRRGGIDINPFRSSDPAWAPANRRAARQ